MAFNKIIENAARKAPNKFAKISKTSALLVVVKYCCINSIAIPKTKEPIMVKVKSLKLFELVNFFFKYKNQRIVNTK